jgi:hypothetical protein
VRGDRCGRATLDRALKLRRSGPYVIQAAIAALHAQATDFDSTDWPQIAALYDARQARPVAGRGGQPRRVGRPSGRPARWPGDPRSGRGRPAARALPAPDAIVALEPAGVVARVAMDVRLAARAGVTVREAYTREVDVARRLVSVGAPVLGPTTSVAPGPHPAGGRLVSFWPRLRDARPAAPDAAGRALGACRAALDEIRDLPVLWLLHEAAELALQPMVADVLGPRAAELARQLEHERAVLAEGQLVAVHGDAGFGNAVEVDGQVLWIDYVPPLERPGYSLRLRQAGHRMLRTAHSTCTSTSARPTATGSDGTGCSATGCGAMPRTGSATPTSSASSPCATGPT